MDIRTVKEQIITNAYIALLATSKQGRGFPFRLDVPFELGDLKIITFQPATDEANRAGPDLYVAAVVMSTATPIKVVLSSAPRSSFEKAIHSLEQVSGEMLLTRGPDAIDFFPARYQEGQALNNGRFVSSEELAARREREEKAKRDNKPAR